MRGKMGASGSILEGLINLYIQKWNLSYMHQWEKIIAPNKEQFWRLFSKEIGAEYIKSGAPIDDKVIIQGDNWTIFLETFRNFDDNVFTRMYTEHVNTVDFEFEIYRKSLLSKLGKLFGMQDINLGFPDFDKNFIIKSNDKSKIKAMLANSKIVSLIQSQPLFFLKLKGYKLYFKEKGVIENVSRLILLYQLFTEILNYLSSKRL